MTGKTFGAYVADAIYAPLGMEHSHTELDEAQADGLTAAHRFWFGIPSAGTPFWRPDFLPAGWLIASATDLGRWAAPTSRAGRSTGNASCPRPAIEQMHAGAVDAGRSRYGMGWFDGRIGTTRTVSHSGSTTDMGSAMYLAPEQGVGLVVLFNGQSLLYEMLHKPEAIAEGAMARLVGEPAGGTLMALYPVFTLAVLAMVALQLRSLVRAAGRARRGEPATRAVLGSRRLGIGLAVWGRFVVPSADPRRARRTPSALHGTSWCRSTWGRHCSPTRCSSSSSEPSASVLTWCGLSVVSRSCACVQLAPGRRLAAPWPIGTGLRAWARRHSELLDLGAGVAAALAILGVSLIQWGVTDDRLDAWRHPRRHAWSGRCIRSPAWSCS